MDKGYRFKELSPRERRALEAWESLRKTIAQDSRPRITETESQKKKRIASYFNGTVEGFIGFVNYYYNYDGKLAGFGWFHREAIQDVAINKNRNNIWEWSRELAKSVLGTIFIPSFLLCEGWLEGLILSSGTEGKAKKLIGDLEAHLRSNQRLIADFGDFQVQGSWTNGYFYTGSGVGFWAFGIGQNPAGVRQGFKRPNLGIMDDADSKKTSKNQELTKEILDWFLGEFCGCLQTKGRMVIFSNNRVSADGLTAHLVGDITPDQPKRQGWKHIKVYWTEDPQTHEMVFPAQDGNGNYLPPTNGEWQPAWVENYSTKQAIDKIVDMGTRNAKRQLYHMDEREGGVFQADHINWRTPLPLPQYDRLVVYVDPSFSDTGDFKAIVLLGRKNKRVDILWAWVRQASVLAMVQAHINLYLELQSEFPSFADQESHVRYRQVACRHYVEGNLQQKMILNPHYESQCDAVDLNWRPRFDERKKPDKQGRIESLSVLFENGTIGWNSEEAGSNDMIVLKNQFLSFPNGNDDGPDAVEGALFYSGKPEKSTDKTRPVRMGGFSKNLDRYA